MFKKIKGYRVVLFNVALLIAALAEAVPIVQDYLPKGWYAWLTFVGALGNGWLRFLTNTPIGMNGEE